jgi:hypothetical protein
MKGFIAFIAYTMAMTILLVPAYVGLHLSGISIPFYAILGVGISHHLISALIHAAVVTRKKNNINYIDPATWISN